MLRFLLFMLLGNSVFTFAIIKQIIVIFIVKSRKRRLTQCGDFGKRNRKIQPKLSVLAFRVLA